MWLDIFIVVICLLSSLIIPVIITYKIKSIRFNPENETLSFLSNKRLFGKKMSEGYTEVLFVTGILSFAFFWLLVEKLHFVDDQSIWKWMIISIGSLILLAFAHHNIIPYKWKYLYENFIRTLHNILAVVVFIALPVLIVKFDIFLFNERFAASLTGMGVIGITIIATIFTLIKKKKLTGITEITFITGICLWNIITTIFVIF